METALHCIRPGKRAVVTRIETAQLLRQRLQSLGLVPGTEIICSYKGPGGKVAAVEFRGTVIALRTRDMQKIRVRC